MEKYTPSKSLYVAIPTVTRGIAPPPSRLRCCPTRWKHYRGHGPIVSPCARCDGTARASTMMVRPSWHIATFRGAGVVVVVVVAAEVVVVVAIVVVGAPVVVVVPIVVVGAPVVVVVAMVVVGTPVVVVVAIVVVGGPVVVPTVVVGGPVVVPIVVVGGPVVPIVVVLMSFRDNNAPPGDIGSPCTPQEVIVGSSTPAASTAAAR
jgi:hypothetical protein